jgi:hypothetical protein
MRFAFCLALLSFSMVTTAHAAEGTALVNARDGYVLDCQQGINRRLNADTKAIRMNLVDSHEVDQDMTQLTVQVDVVVCGPEGLVADPTPGTSDFNSPVNSAVTIHSVFQHYKLIVTGDTSKVLFTSEDLLELESKGTQQVQLTLPTRLLRPRNNPNRPLAFAVQVVASYASSNGVVAEPELESFGAFLLSVK